jgi:hypothetical protein
LEKIPYEKKAGVTGEEKDRQLAEIRDEEESAGFGPIISMPAVTGGRR